MDFYKDDPIFIIDKLLNLEKIKKKQRKYLHKAKNHYEDKKKNKAEKEEEKENLNQFLNLKEIKNKYIDLIKNTFAFILLIASILYVSFCLVLCFIS